MTASKPLPRDRHVATEGKHVTVAVISDIHGVLPALDAVLDEPAVRRADVILALGDIAAGPQPNEVMQRLLSLGNRVSWIIGNADREMVELRRGSRESIPDAIAEWAAGVITEEHIDILGCLPQTFDLNVEGLGPTTFCHATSRSDDEVVLVDSRYQRWDEVFAGIEPRIQTIVCGHTHMPFIRLWRGRLVVNPGSVGMPYGRSGPHWALLGPGVSLMRSTMDLDLACHRVCEMSAFPGIDEWANYFIRGRASDEEVMDLFGRRDGRAISPASSNEP
jgi:predicted phosphodiesterase